MTQDDGQLDSSRMSLISHLDELRRRLMYSIGVVLLLAVISLSFAPQLFEILLKPLENISGQEMIVLSPLEMFITYLKIGVIAAIFLASPWLLFQIWLFIAPGLYKHERRWVAPFVIMGTMFFCAGGLFAFYVVMPLGFEYLVKMVPETVSANYSVALYFALVLRILLAFGLAFELPLAMWILAAAGIANPTAMRNARKYWMVVAVVAAALLTPPDPFTQMLMAVPLILFFELGLFGARFLYKERDAEEETDEQALESDQESVES